MVDELDALNNPRITTLNHLTKLRELNIDGNCGVRDIGIQVCINLEELSARGNPKITSVNLMTNLRKINYDGNYGIGGIGIQDLNLKDVSAGIIQKSRHICMTTFDIIKYWWKSRDSK